MKRKMMLYYGRMVKLLKDVSVRSFEDNITGIGAQMSYYFILAFFPFFNFFNCTAKLYKDNW